MVHAICLLLVQFNIISNNLHLQWSRYSAKHTISANGATNVLNQDYPVAFSTKVFIAELTTGNQQTFSQIYTLGDLTKIQFRISCTAAQNENLSVRIFAIGY